jgi:signal transduction histidine kinase
MGRADDGSMTRPRDNGRVAMEFFRSAEPRPALSRRALAADTALAAVAVVAAVINADIRYRESVAIDFPGYGLYRPVISEGLSLLVMIGVALTAAPLAVRRRYPIAAFCAILAAVFATSQYLTTVTFIVVLLAAYSAVAHSRFRGLAVLSVLLGGIIVTAAFPDTAPPLPGRYTALLVLIPAAALGNAARLWRRQAGDSAKRLRQAQAEHLAATRRAVEQERARIASELHDVVTHNVSVMVVQAGAARRVLDSSPGEAREALLAVEASGRTAMTELRHLLGLLAPAGDEILRPQPGLGQLPSLVARVRAAGLPVELSVTGTQVSLPAGMDLAAYRVVQEALTNIIKHAGPATAQVRIRYSAEDLLIEITDDGGPSGAPAGGGRGLIGLRERIALYGGQLDAGPRPAGGWRVRAAIPLQSDPLRAGVPAAGG